MTMSNTFKTPLQKAVVGWLTAHPDVSQRELGRRSEIDHGDLGKITKGDKASLNMESAGRLAAAMGTTVEGLLEGDPNAVRPAALTAPAVAPAEALSWEKEIPIAFIEPSPFNPRDEKSFDKEGIEELAASIAEVGLLEALIVRPIGDDKYQLMGGERRLRALKLMGARTARCTMRDANDGLSLAIQIIENLQRKDLTAIEEAEAFSALNKLDPEVWTPQAIAKKIGMTERHVQYRLNIARKLVPEGRKALAAGELTVEKARVMAGAPAHVQKELLGHWQLDEMSAEDIRSHILEEMIPVGRNAFDIALYTGEFFEDGKKRYFVDTEKFAELQHAAAEALLDKLRATWPDAKIVEADELHSWEWADTGKSLSWSDRKGTKATGKFKVAREKCNAIVWIDRNANLRHAEGVASEKVMARAGGRTSSGYGGSRPKAESAGHRRYRHAYNAAVGEAVAAHPEAGLRLLLTRFIDGTTRATYDHSALKKANEGILTPELQALAVQHGKHLKIWALVAKLPIAEVTAMIARYTALSINWQHNAWSKSASKPDEFTTLIADVVKAKLPKREEFETAKKATPKAKAKAKAKTKAKTTTKAAAAEARP